MLLNLAAGYSALANEGRRNEGEGMKVVIGGFQVRPSPSLPPSLPSPPSCAVFPSAERRTDPRSAERTQNAAGALSHLLTLLPSLVDDEGLPLSPDLTAETVESLRDLMLAQAQEVFWQKGVMGGSLVLLSLSPSEGKKLTRCGTTDRLKNGTISKLALSCSTLYGSSLSHAMAAKTASFSFPEVRLCLPPLRAPADTHEDGEPRPSRTISRSNSYILVRWRSIGNLLMIWERIGELSPFPSLLLFAPSEWRELTSAEGIGMATS